MTTLEIFENVFGENVFVKSRKREIVDKRIAAYTFMRKMMKMTYREIADATGRTHATVINGVKRFTGFLEVGDADAVKLYVDMYNHIIPFLTQYGGPVPAIETDAEFGIINGQ